MGRFSTKIRFISFLLIVGFVLTSLGDSFFCVDDPGAVHADSQCCMQCQNLHTMNVANKISVLSDQQEFSRMRIYTPFFAIASFPSRIERPPIIPGV